MFEFTVLCSCVGMVLTFCYLCQLAPFVRKHHFHLRSTDDLFVMVIECTAKTNEAEVTAFLTGTLEQKKSIYKYAETGWWLGRYDKEQKLLIQEQKLLLLIENIIKMKKLSIISVFVLACGDLELQRCKKRTEQSIYAGYGL